VLAMAIGSLIIYFLGAIHLALFAHLGVKKALLLGVVPFLPGDILKLFAASSLYYKLQERAGQIFPR
ncbi:biotin transporter BioY, partial [bacterium]|nr:biotin transporter BioY [bacterium]